MMATHVLEIKEMSFRYNKEIYIFRMWTHYEQIEDQSKLQTDFFKTNSFPLTPTSLKL